MNGKALMAFWACVLLACIFIWFFSFRSIFATAPSIDTLTERVEQVVWRTELRHAGCSQGGFWRASGPPRKIEAYGIDKWIHLHVCSGCGATNEIYDARWPQFRQEWRAVK